MNIIKQGLITSQRDFVRLGIIDWNRLNGTSVSIADAMHDISSWFIGTSTYTIVEHDLSLAPQRRDFPEWEHEGNTHTRLARMYWNDFKQNHPDSELILSDEPDFLGTLNHEGKKAARFWGDFGRVSASAFAITAIRKMNKGDIWISIINDTQQIIIETHESMEQRFYDNVVLPLTGEMSPRKLELLRSIG